MVLTISSNSPYDTLWLGSLGIGILLILVYSFPYPFAPPHPKDASLKHKDFPPHTLDRTPIMH